MDRRYGFMYVQFDGDGPVLGAVIDFYIANVIKDWETDGLHEQQECKGWIHGLVDGINLIEESLRHNFCFDCKKYKVEEFFIGSIKEAEKIKEYLDSYGMWSEYMEDWLQCAIDESERKKQKALKELDEGESYWYCWGFSGVDRIDEDSIKYDVEPDFICQGTERQAEIETFLKAREDLESYRGLHGVPSEEEMDEDEFTEYANYHVVVIIKEKFAFDKENKNKSWELEI